MSRYKSKGGGTPEVYNARSKLDGLLQTLMDKKDDSPIKEEPLDDSELSHSAPSTPKKGGGGARSSRKRKRGKDDLLPAEATQYHHTYVMKLFDRSVDLAQFQEESPLYPVCRAWMKNQPHNRNLAPHVRLPSPDPIEDGADLVDDIGLPLIYSLPTPIPIIKSEDGQVEIDMRVPAPIAHTDEALDIHADPILAPPSEHLLLSHMIRWKQVRQSWKDAARLNEMRYGESMATLKDMFDNQCKDQ